MNKRAVLVLVALVASLPLAGLGAAPAAAAPTLTSFTPTGTTITGNVQLTIQGSDFSNPTVALVKKAQVGGAVVRTITATSVSVDGGTVIAELPTTGEEPGGYSVRVRNADDTFSDLPGFTIAGGPPAIANLNPSAIKTGSQQTFSIFGTNFTRNAGVTVTDNDGNPLNGANVDSVTWKSVSQLEVKVTVPAGSGASAAALGDYDVTVSQPRSDQNDPSPAPTPALCNECLNVSAPPAPVPVPQVESRTSSSSGFNDDPTFEVTVLGRNFPDLASDAGARLVGYCPPATPNCSMAGRSIPIANITVGTAPFPNDPTLDELSGAADLTFESPGAYSIEVLNKAPGNGQAGTLLNSVRVNATGQPSVSTPSTASPEVTPFNEQTTVTVAGAHFARGVTVTSGHANLLITNLAAVSSTTLTFSVQPDEGLVNGLYDFTVANTDGQSFVCNDCIEVTGVPVPPPQYTPLTPVRLLDSRSGAKVSTSGRTLSIAGANSVPADAGAVVLNVTAVAPDGPGFLTVYPCTAGVPGSSNLNFAAGQTIPNLVVVALDANGDACFRPNAATHVLVDLNGYFPAGARFTGVTPFRALDTRDAGGTKLQPNVERQLAIGGTNVLPADASAAVLNVTAANPSGPGHLVVYPCGSPKPDSSNLNVVAGLVVPNAVVSKLGTSGRVCLQSSVLTDVIVDVGGYFPAAADYVAQTPARALDTRRPADAPKLGAAGVRSLQVTGNLGVPAGAGAVVVNVTVTEPEGPGFVTVYPCTGTLPTSSNLNYVAGQTVPNLVVAKLDANGKLCIYTHAASHVIVDQMGYFPAA